ncbi:hypothetical protein D9619_011956 [Psilocybe cf. subviscida]|uniref:Uncharacterized protein n=1 Tax=Psilocybe cf. subviscida TaxID=2480587 RepID=A0A8H5B1W6_9AGAR|nr:hypothetical protein D9619_011956 [Psilocybe cf. subviscida]
MAPSRTDLLAWLNELLQTNNTKAEQCGAGSTYLRLLDSIYGEPTVYCLQILHSDERVSAPHPFPRRFSGPNLHRPCALHMGLSLLLAYDRGPGLPFFTVRASNSGKALLVTRSKFDPASVLCRRRYLVSLCKLRHTMFFSS